MKRSRGEQSAQLDLIALLPGALEVDLTDRAHKGIAIRLKDSGLDPVPPVDVFDAPVSGHPGFSASATLPSQSILPEPDVTYSGIRVVNGRVVREGRHSDSQWNFVGLAGALPRRIYDYDLDVVLERRTDVDGVVRLLPIQDTPGEPLDSLHYVVVDVETTGAGFTLGHRITEVCIVHMRGDGRVLDEFGTLVNPERPIPRMITELTHISGAMVRKAPRFRDIAGEVRERLQGKIFVAHNAGFDWRFLSMELQMALGEPLRGRMLCTVRMARKLVPEMPRRSLDALSWYFGVHNEARHRAFGDARATAEVFGRMMQRAGERQVTGWNELQKLLYARAPRRKRLSTPQSFDPLA